jgi:hypothetical protein
MTQAAPLFAASPYMDSVGFYALLPVLCYSGRRYSTTLGSAAIRADGTFDPTPFSTNEYFIYALGEIALEGPNWVTTLLPVRHLMHSDTLDAIAAALPLPLTDISRGGKHPFTTGGRNGVLIAPTDPRDEATLDDWFTAHPKYHASKAYVTRIEYTPPELRGDFHQNALNRWKTLRAANRQEREAREVDKPRPEPSPDADNAVWKGWLKHRRGHPQSKGSFVYIGIPLVGQGYQTAHITGAKNILALLPRQASGAARAGPLRNAFVPAAAALLCVPKLYQQAVSQQGQTIAQTRSAKAYDASQFGDAGQLGVNNVARYLASVGVTVAEAEGWRAWACAYVEMDLDMHPDSPYAPMLRTARTRARACIDNDQSLVLTGIHPVSPGNYNPERERVIAERNAQQPAEARARPSRVVEGSDAAVHRGAEDDDVQLSYQDQPDEDSSMGPG